MQKLRSVRPLHATLLAAAAVFAAGLAEHLVGREIAGADVPMAVACSALSATGVAVALRHPFTGIVLAILALYGFNTLPREVVDGAGVPWLTLIGLMFWMARRTEGRALAVRLAAAYLLMCGQALTDQYQFAALDFVFAAIILVAAPTAVGQLLRSRARLADALREKVQLAERTRAREAEAAVAAERERIAGELHDVVAHALGAMTVQASAARRLAGGDRDRAIEAFHAVEDTGRAALNELRLLLGVLRREDEDLALAPQPKLAYLSDLVRRTAAAGLPVELSVEGRAPEAIPAGVDLTGYRVVQQALRDAMSEGAAGRAEVRLRYADTSFEIEVTDDGHGRARSLLGMEERVSVYGGQLRTEHGADRHRVLARLPLEATP